MTISHHLQAFWDSLVDDLCLKEPCYVRVFRVLAEIRDGICDLAGSRESEVLRDIIDIDFIRKQVDIGAFDWGSCKRLVGGVLDSIRRIQAPARDAETHALWKSLSSSMLAADVDQPRILCKALEFLLDRVNVLRIDAANSR